MKRRIKKPFLMSFDARIVYITQTPERWAVDKRILLPNELVFDTNGRYKLGDGEKTWRELPYAKNLRCKIENRNPQESDIAEIGQLWFNTITNEKFILVSDDPIEWRNVLDSSYTKEEIDNFLIGKVDFEPGKILSSNDFTDKDKHYVHKIPGLIDKSSFNYHIKDKVDAINVYNSYEFNNKLNEKLDEVNAQTKDKFDAKIINKVDKHLVYNKNSFNRIINIEVAKKAPLVNGLIPKQYLTHLNIVIDIDGIENFPLSGMPNKLYIDTKTSKLYRWNGTSFVEIQYTVEFGNEPDTPYKGADGLSLEKRYDNVKADIEKIDALLGDLIHKNIIDTNSITNNSIIADDLADNSITENKLLDNSISSNKLTDNVISECFLSDNSVTNEKISDVNINKINFSETLICVPE